MFGSMPTSDPMEIMKILAKSAVIIKPSMVDVNDFQDFQELSETPFTENI